MAVKQHNHRTARVTYLIGEVGTDFIKVGVTRSRQSLRKRISDERSGNPRELRVLHTWLFDRDNLAFDLEQAILKQFANRRMRRTEWLRDITVEEIRIWRAAQVGQLTKQSECLSKSVTKSEATLQS